MRSISIEKVKDKIVILPTSSHDAEEGGFDFIDYNRSIIIDAVSASANELYEMILLAKDRGVQRDLRGEPGLFDSKEPFYTLQKLGIKTVAKYEGMVERIISIVFFEDLNEIKISPMERWKKKSWVGTGQVFQISLSKKDEINSILAKELGIA